MPYDKTERRKLGYPVGKVLEKNSSGKMETVDYDSSSFISSSSPVDE